MAYQLFNEETGVVSELKKKKTKRTEPFFMMKLTDAESIAKEKGLHGTEYRILFFILSRIDYENRAMLSQSFIAKQLEMPQPQVSTAIKKLTECNVIRKVSVDGQNGYIVSDTLVSRGSEKQ